jgi:hypothetical protein
MKKERFDVNTLAEVRRYRCNLQKKNDLPEIWNLFLVVLLGEKTAGSW